MTWQFLTVLPVWLLSLAGAIVVGLTVPGTGFYTWLGVVLAAAVIATFAIQLATRRTEGFVTRAMASIGVSLVILAAATGILAIISVTAPALA